MLDPSYQDDSKFRGKLAEYLTERMREGDYDTVFDWVPDSFQGSMLSDISFRTRATKKVKLALSSTEENILTYFSSLIRGFLQLDENKRYLVSSLTDVGERIVFPIYHINELRECLAQFQAQKPSDYHDTLRELVKNVLGDDKYVDLWQAGGIADMVLPPRSDGQAIRPGQVAPSQPLAPPVWRAYGESPRSHQDPEWLASLTHPKSVDLNSDPMRVSVPAGGNDLNGNRQIKYDEHTGMLLKKEKELRSRQEKMRKKLIRLLNGAVVNQFFKQRNNSEAMEAAEAVEAGVDIEVIELVEAEEAGGGGEAATGVDPEIRALHTKCRRLCEKIAKLAASTNYWRRVRMLHDMQLVPTLGRLKRIIGESERGRLIPVKTTDELRYHIHFFMQHLQQYCEESMRQVLLRASWVDAQSVVKEVTKFQKSEMGSHADTFLRNKLRKVFDKLYRLNPTHKTRAESERELRKILVTVDNLLNEVAELAQTDANVSEAAENEFRHCQDATTLQKVRRRDVLVQLAPIDTDPDSIESGEQLWALYEGTGLTREGLLELYETGFSDISRLLHLALQHVDRADREKLILHLLSQGALVDYAVDGVHALSRAYDPIFKGREAEDGIRSLNWRIFALLSGAKQLFESIEGKQWLATSVQAVLTAVQGVHQDGVATRQGVPYQARDGALVEGLLRRLFLTTFLDAVNKQTIRSSIFFQLLCGIWEYLDVPIQTQQMLPGESHSVSCQELEKAVLPAVMAIFSSRLSLYREAQAAKQTLLTRTPEGERVPQPERDAFRDEVNRYDIREEKKQELDDMRRDIREEEEQRAFNSVRQMLINGLAAVPQLANGDGVSLEQLLAFVYRVQQQPGLLQLEGGGGAVAARIDERDRHREERDRHIAQQVQGRPELLAQGAAAGPSDENLERRTGGGSPHRSDPSVR